MTSSNRLPVLAEEIRKQHRAAVDAATTATEHAIECGRLLTQAKESLKHGEWLPWLREHCDIAERTAQAYMRLARMVAGMDDAKSATVADLPLRAALKALADHHVEAVMPPADAPADEIWVWAKRQVDGPFNSIDMEHLGLFETKLLRQLDLSFTAQFCLGLICERDIELPAGKIPAIEADEIPVLRLVQWPDLRDALEKLHMVASGNFQSLDVDFDELQRCSRPRLAANFGGVATIAAARFAGFVLNEIDCRAAFETDDAWHADAVRVHAAMMEFLDGRCIAFEKFRGQA